MSETESADAGPGPWLKWAHVHCSLVMDDYPTRDQAILAAYYAAEEGAESLECIEGPDGVVPQEVVDAELARLEAADAAAWTARASEVDRLTHVVGLRGPFGVPEIVTVGWFESAAEAEAAAVVWRARFGDRVSVRDAGGAR